MSWSTEDKYAQGFTKDKLNKLRGRFTGSAGNKNEEASEAKYPATNEPMLVHPQKQHLVKLRDNGDIDIFTGGNMGIRISMATQGINLFATEEKHHVSFIRGFVTKDIHYNVKGSWTIQCEQHANINTKGNVNITAKGNLNVSAESMNFNSKGRVRFTASRYDFD